MRCAFLLGLSGALLAPPSASAQTQSVPGGVEPGRIPQQHQRPPGPAPTPEVVAPEIPETAPPAEAARIRFTLRRIVVDGSTVYTAEQFKALYGDLLGREVTLADIYRIADAITTRYRSDGYILSRAVVPAQRIVDGVVHITVIEGFIHRVTIQGKENAVTRSYADQLTRSRPLTNRDLQRYLLLINDLPGTRARGVLAPATGITGGSDLTLIVESKDSDAAVVLDNRGSKFIGPTELFGEGALNDPTGFADRLALRYITVPAGEKELRFVELNYGVPVGADGLKFFLSASANKSDPGSTLQTAILRTEARGQTVTGRLSYPVTRSRRENLLVDVSLSLSNSTLDQFSLPADNKLTSSYEDRIRALRAGIGYDTTDGWEGRDFVRVELSRGLPILGASDGGRLSGASRAGGRSQFWKATVDASRLQSLNSLEPGLGLLMAISAGTSFGQQLLAAEQFGVGGSQYGRGYDSSEITGDYGAAAKAELQYSFDADVGRWRPTFQAYAFYDFGLVADENPRLVGQESGTRSLASAGLGIRISLDGRYLVGFEIAQPLTRAVSAFADKADKKPLRAYFSAIAAF